MKLKLGIPLVLTLLVSLTGPPGERAGAGPPLAEGWQPLGAGLDLGRFLATRPSRTDSVIHALRIDPARWKLVLQSASATDGRTRTAKEWCRRGGLVAAINASMYQADLKTSVSLMRTGGHINNPRLSKDMTVLAFDPVGTGLPPVKMIDRECDPWPTWKTRYRTLVQSIRMVSCKGANTWSPQAREWSTAAIGLDQQGRVLFLHSRAPWSTHDFIDALKRLPLALAQAMYAEGGPEAQLYVRHGGRELELVGSYETGFHESDDNPAAWPVPNVIGVAARQPR